MGERQPQQVGVSQVQEVAVLPCGAHVRPGAMFDLHSLGGPGGPGGVHDRGQVTGLDRVDGATYQIRVLGQGTPPHGDKLIHGDDAVVVDVVQLAIIIEDDDVTQVLVDVIIAQRLGKVGRGVDEEHAGLGVGEDVAGLLRPGVGVDRRRGTTGT